MIAVDDFVRSCRNTGKAAGLPDLRIAAYPGAVAIHPTELLEKNIREIVFPQIVQLLTQPPAPSFTKNNRKQHTHLY